MKIKLARPEIKDGLLRAAVMRAKERSNEVHQVSLTEYINALILEDWEKNHPKMMFPNEKGDIEPIEYAA